MLLLTEHEQLLTCHAGLAQEVSRIAVQVARLGSRCAGAVLLQQPLALQEADRSIVLAETLQIQVNIWAIRSTWAKSKVNMVNDSDAVSETVHDRYVDLA